MKTVARFEKVSFEEWSNTYHEEEWIKRLTYDTMQLPNRKTKGSAGYDFIAPFDITIRPKETIKIPTGVKCYIEEGYVLEIYPRSSLGFKYKMQLDNTVGIIDSDYYNNKDNEGHIQAKFTNHSDKEIYIPKGVSYMQGIFKEFFLAEEDEVTTKRTGGIGSTNK